ncbi:hypothetical protein O0I10_008870 [Lichtheimia ornata]|uniref:Uncharacterized protein n=1 Tax=Lichtheimia ornata TaxID=688661 RepID=A0AAD7UYE3_9FUNG|nr:uncharacterized protein O0I10_008870 [Lichtheimia ornata]KAJ8655378.1 hypothetical protein O0I10_008870 [Lichtheimia ornata]
MGSITRVTLAAMTIMTLITQQAMGAPAQQQGCQGIDVLYPKDGSSFSRSEQETIYLILGNKLEDAKLDKVSVTRHEDGKTLVKDMWTAIDKDETLSNIVVLQQDLQQLNTVLPDQFTFRIHIQQDDKQCVYQSPSFQVTE